MKTQTQTQLIWGKPKSYWVEKKINSRIKELKEIITSHTKYPGPSSDILVQEWTQELRKLQIERLGI